MFSARASILTGGSSNHAHVVTNIDQGSLGLPPSQDLPTLATLFRSAGYSTGYFGKWHLGGASSGPEKFGFDKANIGFPQNSGAQADKPVTEAASEWIRNQKGAWMAWVSLLDPHGIYFPPKGFDAAAVRMGVQEPFSGADNLRDKPEEQKKFYERSEKIGNWLKYRSYYCQLVENIDGYLGAIPVLNSKALLCTTN